jgi:hypothetical protein
MEGTRFAGTSGKKSGATAAAPIENVEASSAAKLSPANAVLKIESRYSLSWRSREKATYLPIAVCKPKSR